MYDSRYWPGLGGLDLLLAPALGVGVELPGLDRLLDRLVLLSFVGDLVSVSSPLPSTGLLVERLGVKVGLDRVADAVMAAVEPGEDLERLAGHQHVARADDGAARFVDHLGGDRVLWS